MTGEDRFIARFLRLLPAKKLVIIAIMELLTEPSHGDSVRTTRAVIQVGKAIEMEHHFLIARKEDLPIPNFQPNQVPYNSANAYLELHKRRIAAKLQNEGRENWMPSGRRLSGRESAGRFSIASCGWPKLLAPSRVRTESICGSYSAHWLPPGFKH